jgi:hypothetical protein
MGSFKTCPKCALSIGDWRQTCDCGFVFFAERPSDRPSLPDAPPLAQTLGVAAVFATGASLACWVFVFSFQANPALLVVSPVPSVLGLVLGIVAVWMSPKGRAPWGATAAIIVGAVVSGLGLLLLLAMASGGFTPGRPLRVFGLRLLPSVRRGRELARRPSGDDPRVDSVPSETRSLLVRLWLADARAEFASVAAFEYLALDLAAAGAPSELVDWARRAALEEVGHATSCFAVASAYAAREISPLPLPSFLSALRASTTGRTGSRAKLIERLAVDSLVEGCIEEGVAAEVARVGAHYAEDPAIAKVLGRIAREEASHAELAYAIVAWAVREQPSVLAALGPSLERSRHRRRASRTSGELLEFGRLDGERVNALADHAYAMAHGYVSTLVATSSRADHHAAA